MSPSELSLPSSSLLELSVPERLKALASKFAQDLEGVADSSRALYRRALLRYFSWLGEQGLSLAEVEASQIRLYKDSLTSASPKLSSLTISSYLGAVRRFYSWAESHKLYPDVAKGVKSPKRNQQFRKQPLTPDKAKELLAHCQTLGARDYAMVSLLLRTGLRTIELVRADVGDIKIRGSQRVLEIQGKGRTEKDDFVVLTDKAYRPIAEYLETRPEAQASDPLFTSLSNNSKGQRLTTRKVSQVAKEGLKAVELNDRAFTAHSLRHTTAVNILRAGGTLEDAQLTLRHRNQATTQIYTFTLLEQQRLERSGEALLDSVF